MTPPVDPREVAEAVERGEVIDGGVVHLEVRYAGVGPWGVERLAEAHARELARKGFVAGVRINGGPELR